MVNLNLMKRPHSLSRTINCAEHVDESGPLLALAVYKPLSASLQNSKTKPKQNKKSINFNFKFKLDRFNSFLLL